MAAAEVNRPLYYCTFGNQKFAEKLKTCHELLTSGKHTVGKSYLRIQYTTLDFDTISPKTRNILFVMFNFYFFAE